MKFTSFLLREIDDALYFGCHMASSHTYGGGAVAAGFLLSTEENSEWQLPPLPSLFLHLTPVSVSAVPFPVLRRRRPKGGEINNKNFFICQTSGSSSVSCASGLATSFLFGRAGKRSKPKFVQDHDSGFRRLLFLMVFFCLFGPHLVLRRSIRIARSRSFILPK